VFEEVRASYVPAEAASSLPYLRYDG